MKAWFLIVISSIYVLGCSGFKSKVNNKGFVTTDPEADKPVETAAVPVKEGYTRLKAKWARPTKTAYVYLENVQLKIEEDSAYLYFTSKINGHEEEQNLFGELNADWEAELFSETSGSFAATLLCLDFEVCSHALVDVYYTYKGKQYRKRFDRLKVDSDLESSKPPKEEKVTLLEDYDELDFGKEGTQEEEPELKTEGGYYVGIRPSKEFYSKLKDVSLADFKKAPKKPKKEMPKGGEKEGSELLDGNTPGGSLDDQTEATKAKQPQQSQEEEVPQPKSVERENEGENIGEQTPIAPSNDLGHESGPEQEGENEKLAPIASGEVGKLQTPTQTYAEDEGYGQIEIDPDTYAEFDQSQFKLNFKEGGHCYQEYINRIFYGELFDASVLAEGEGLVVTSARKKIPTNYGTGWMVSLLENSFGKYKESYPSDQLYVSSLSAENGGALAYRTWVNGKLVQRHHKSHKAGLDADVAYLNQEPGFKRYVSDKNVTDSFDFDRNFAYFTILVKTNTVNYILVNKAIREAFCQWGKANGLLQDYKEVFRRIYGISGHSDHFHLRLKCSPEYKRCQNQPGPPESNACG